MLLSLFPYREAVRQRKALSRTSSNILLNSVHLQNQSYNYQPSNNRMKLQNSRPSDCEEPNLVVKESHQESHSEVSELEVNLLISLIVRKKQMYVCGQFIRYLIACS